MLKRFWKVQFTFTFSYTQVLLKPYLLNRITIKGQWKVTYRFCLFCLDQGTYFPLNQPSIYFSQVNIQMVTEKFTLSTIKRRKICSEENSVWFYSDGKIVYLVLPLRYILSVNLLKYLRYRLLQNSTILYLLKFMKSVRVLKRLPDTPLCFKLHIRPLSHTLQSFLQ